MNEPAADNLFQADYAMLLLDSYRRLTGRDLLPPQASSAQALYHAPFVLLSHDAATDPRFVYANLAAQARFEMPWREIVGMPSRYSAEAPERAERQRLLERVSRQGYIDDYCGVRIARSGRRFLVRNASVWNLIGGVGQAAAFAQWQDLE